jgi:hypothetical protein
MLNEHSVVKWIGHVSKKIRHKIVQAQEETAKELVAEAQQKLPKDLGRMERGYKVRTRDVTTTLSNTQHYIQYIDEGRRGFRGAPLPLQRWVTRRLHVPAYKAYGVARAIAATPKEGKHFFSGPGELHIAHKTKEKLRRLLK